MLEWVWLGINGIIGIPLAFAALILAREAIRTMASLAFGFRVFAIRLGVGPTLFENPFGPINLSLGRWPLAGATLARSGVPRRHRLGRATCAIAPLAAQLLWLAYRSTGNPPLLDALRAGLSPLAVLDIANVVLLGVHCVVPFEVAHGVRSDVRLLLDSFLAQFDSDRTARASYYARLCRHRLERGDSAAAGKALDQGLVQLGPESMLVRCQERFLQTDLDSVVDQGDCANDLETLIEAAEPKRSEARARWTVSERLHQYMISTLPAGFLLLVLVVVQSDRIAFGIESIYMHRAERVAAQQDPLACTAQLSRWNRWIQRSDPFFSLPAIRQSDRHAGLASLQLCRGDLAAAADHQGEAMLAANAARARPLATLLSEPERWLDDELRMTVLLRQAAAVENEQRSFRRALGTLGKAEKRLDGLVARIAVWADEGDRSEAASTIEAEREQVLALRQEVLASLAGG